MSEIDRDDPFDRRAVAASEQLVASFADLDTEAALDAARTDVRSVDHVSRHPARVRWFAIAAAVALVLGGTVALAASVATRSGSTDAPAPSQAPAAGTIDPSLTTADTTTAPAATAAGESTNQVGAVSFSDPPPVFPIRSLGTVTVPAASDGDYAVAIGDTGVAVSQWLYSGSEPTRIDVIGFDGQIRMIPNIGAYGLLAYGPEDVAYFTRQSTNLEDFVIVAVPLSGENAGTLPASEPADVNLFLEYPPLSFGHGADGIIHRRGYLQDQPTIIEYVGADGQRPVALEVVPPTFAFGSPDDAGRGLGGVVTSSTGTSWTLTVDAAPNRASTYVGASPPAAGPNGSGVYVTHIGPDAQPNADFGEPTMWVIATLKPDGTATWSSIPVGWRVVASDIWGTVLARQSGTQLELALAAVPVPEAPPPSTPTTSS